ncbi:hypothetical protein E1B28_012586 [Marasmius oreades]|uniref:Sensitive to high expression protein 9, mitochondrial n=1 Tax=Marasmius oreades TaxID=181124 RepID=A0A9P7RSF1_9AGAR|nr:uncharacterized protein E1B28_012586 [Marasmius oreades]KAG7088612.1 hypothetical protein E1B28_012586 [Marasmius oreades]
MFRTYNLRTKRPFSTRQFSYTYSSRKWAQQSNDATSTSQSSKDPLSSSSPERQQSGHTEAGPSSSSPRPSPSGTQSEAETSSHSNPSFADLGYLKSNVRKWTDEAVVNFRKKADDFSGSTKTRFSQVGAELNKVTGYDEIEALKRQVVAQEVQIKEARQAARDAKILYQQAVLQRSSSQRELNDLLQRKSSWTDQDVIRFTTLVREDHTFVQEEARAKGAVDETEEAVEKEFNELTRTILTRYHEEQVWSDKIRSASTYGQLAALGLNLLVFILAIVVVEPWKRRRLAQTFEKKIEEMELEYKTVMEGHMKEVQQRLESQVASLVTIADVVSKLDSQLQRIEVLPEVEAHSEPRVLEPGIWAKAVKDRHFGEAVATGAIAATVLSALGWIWLGG